MRLGGMAMAAALWAAAGAAQDGLDFVSLGSGELDGGYHRAAQAICDAVNAANRGRVRCSPEVTPGSRYNLDALLAGELDLAIVQADLTQAALASGEDRLRLVARLYDETLTVLVAPRSGVRDLAGLEGKRVDIGPPASGRHATLRAILDALDTPAGFFDAVSELPGESAVDALCTGAVDAVILVVGHPSALVARATGTCGAEVVPFLGPRVNALAAEADHLRLSRVPAADYTALDADVPTLGMGAALLTRADLPERVIAAIAGTILADHALLGRRAPQLRGLTPAGLREAGAGPPPHPGAAAAYGGGS